MSMSSSPKRGRIQTLTLVLYLKNTWKNSKLYWSYMTWAVTWHRNRQYWENIIESQMVWVGRAFKAHLVPPPAIGESYGEQFQGGKEDMREGKVGVFLWREGSASQVEAGLGFFGTLEMSRGFFWGLEVGCWIEKAWRSSTSHSLR